MITSRKLSKIIVTEYVLGRYEWERGQKSPQSWEFSNCTGANCTYEVDLETWGCTGHAGVNGLNPVLVDPAVWAKHLVDIAAWTKLQLENGLVPGPDPWRRRVVILKVEEHIDAGAGFHPTCEVDCTFRVDPDTWECVGGAQQWLVMVDPEVWKQHCAEVAQWAKEQLSRAVAQSS